MSVSTPLHLVSSGENVEVARMLVECGANMIAQDKSGRRVGICACESTQGIDFPVTSKHRSRQFLCILGYHGGTGAIGGRSCQRMGPPLSP
jgi:hypothetical protein